MVVKEFIASCPKCLTMETLWFWGNRLQPTKRFTQESDGKVYHDCGSQLPCQLFFGTYRVGSQTNAVASVTAATAAHTGRHHTAETRGKMSAAKKGRHHTAEHKAKIAAAVSTPEARAKQSAAHTDKHPTVETRAKISAALTRRHNIEKAGLLSSERSG